MPKKILIVEDEKPMAKALQLKLNNSGYEAEVVFDGESALNFLKKKKVDLIILDLVMPKLDGFGVLKSLKDKKNKIPVIVASNLGQVDDIQKAKDLGAKDYFVKSDTSLKEVIENIVKVLGK